MHAAAIHFPAGQSGQLHELCALVDDLMDALSHQKLPTFTMQRFILASTAFPDDFQPALQLAAHVGVELHPLLVCRVTLFCLAADDRGGVVLLLTLTAFVPRAGQCIPTAATSRRSLANSADSGARVLDRRSTSGLHLHQHIPVVDLLILADLNCRDLARSLSCNVIEHLHSRHHHQHITGRNNIPHFHLDLRDLPRERRRDIHRSLLRPRSTGRRRLHGDVELFVLHPRGMDSPRHQIRVCQEAQQEVRVDLQPLHDESGHSCVSFLQCLSESAATNNQLCNHRVVVRYSHISLLHCRFNTNTSWLLVVAHSPTSAWLQPDPNLNCKAIQLEQLLLEAQRSKRLSTCNPDLHGNKVDPRHLFGDGMLHLNPWIQLKEVE
mmetsp:Transcript_84842/g.226792  ORF Transcript_84842/g.226792 Transcript_84842/m.226792 type:complete len:380 (-) Transcript_84842:522-1661(-)